MMKQLIATLVLPIALFGAKTTSFIEAEQQFTFAFNNAITTSPGMNLLYSPFSLSLSHFETGLMYYYGHFDHPEEVTMSSW